MAKKELITSKIDDKKLTQTRGRGYRSFELAGDGVVVEYKEDRSYSKWKIPYEQVEFDEVCTNRKPENVEVALFVSFFFNMVALAFFLAWLIDGKKLEYTLIGILSVLTISLMSAWARHLFKHEEIKRLDGEQSISFHYRETDKPVVDEFIETLRKSRRNFIRKKYATIDEYIPIETQQDSLLWMYQNKHIEKGEYERLLQELNDLRLIRGD
jgi:hypothetical protein